MIKPLGKRRERLPRTLSESESRWAVSQRNLGGLREGVSRGGGAQISSSHVRSWPVSGDRSTPQRCGCLDKWSEEGLGRVFVNEPKGILCTARQRKQMDPFYWTNTTKHIVSLNNMGVANALISNLSDSVWQDSANWALLHCMLSNFTHLDMQLFSVFEIGSCRDV